MTALFALASAVLVGGADFVGGIASRTYNGVRVAALAQVSGLFVALPIAVMYPAERVGGDDIGWSLGSGIAVGLGIGFFYTAMGRGLISVVAPLAAVTGAVIPVAYAVARGERPGALAVAGLVIAIVAVAIVSIAPAEQHAEAGDVDIRVITQAIASGVFFGLFYIGFSRISEDAGLWPVAIERIAAAIVLILVATTLTRGRLTGVRRLVPYLVAIALLEVLATVPVLLALQRGPVAIASVLASLYPVTTVVLAGTVLRERLSPLQYVGVGCALAAVILVSTG